MIGNYFIAPSRSTVLLASVLLVEGLMAQTAVMRRVQERRKAEDKVLAKRTGLTVSAVRTIRVIEGS